jgi:isopentenyl-diphosphate delta-isomerase
MTTPILIPAWVDNVLTPVEKLDVHLHGLRHKAVSVFAMNQGHILIQQRALHKYHTPGLWANTCCTHPIWDETPAACAARRMQEELGILGLTYTHQSTLEYRANVGNAMIEHEVVDVFMSHGPNDMHINLNPEEVSAIRWITPEDLKDELKAQPDKFTPWLHIYMVEHFDTILGSK